MLARQRASLASLGSPDIAPIAEMLLSTLPGSSGAAGKGKERTKTDGAASGAGASPASLSEMPAACRLTLTQLTSTDAMDQH